MNSRRALLILFTVTSASIAVFTAACSSDSGTSTPKTTPPADSGTTPPAEAGADTSTPADSGIPPGSVALADGPCTQDVDCAASTRGTVGCFIGGMGGGGGDGGGSNAAYCSLKCSPTGVANTTTCAAPFLEFCNNRGYCKLH